MITMDMNKLRTQSSRNTTVSRGGVLNFVTRSRAEDDQSRMFWRLFKYISGENADGQKIDMTVPVTTRMQEVQTGVYNKRMCFYVPEKFQANPPKPTNKAVSIETIGYDDVIVKRFGGYVMNDALWVNHAQRFREEIESIDIEGYDLSFFTSAGYDSPMTLWNRRNEVMFQKL